MRAMRSSATSSSRGIALAVGVSLAALAACADGPTGAAPRKPAAAADDGFDPCEGAKPPAKDFRAILRGVRCEQEKFLRMAKVAKDLGVDCDHCHVPNPEKADSFFYEQMTPNKETALWMHETFMTGLRRRDGEPMTCSACHVDKAGKPAAKFLGQPRDLDFTVEWMTSVMTTRFETLGGDKLKCKTCHVGGWGTPAFEKKVIGRSEQVPRGPAEPPVPSGSATAEIAAPPEPAPTTPSASAAPSASPSASSAPRASVAPPLPSVAPSARPAPSLPISPSSAPKN
jgi:hypothetical protein